MNPSALPVALAFGSGLVAAVNPCGFAILPAFLAHYLGRDAASDIRPGIRQLWDGTVAGLLLSAGFVAVFGIAGLIFGLGAHFIVKVVPWLAIILGFILVGVGVTTLSGRTLPFRIRGLSGAKRGYGSLLGFGIAYAIGSLSCTLPIFILVIGSGLGTGSLPGAVSVFIAYAFGISTVLMVVCVAAAAFRDGVLSWFRRMGRHVEHISGALLVLGGAWIIYYWGSVISGKSGGRPVQFVQSFQRRIQSGIGSVGDLVWVVVGGLLLISVFWLMASRRQPQGEMVEALDQTEDLAAR